MADRSNPLGRSTRMTTSRLFVVIALVSVGAMVLMPDTGWSQQNPQRSAFAPRINPTQGVINPTGVTDPTPGAQVADPPNAALDHTSALGEALSACDKTAAVQDTFALPGLKGEVTLDRCYKGRAHLICVFTALSTEAKSLTRSYTKIVEAKYPEVNSVDGLCQLNAESLASDIAGSEDFNKRFAILKLQYESASKCAANVKQAFKDVVLADMTQPPEILKSMTDSIEGDISKVSEVQSQISELAAKMELSKKAMKTLTKIHRAMCTEGKGAESIGN
jgi:hypothetical protein